MSDKNHRNKTNMIKRIKWNVLYGGGGGVESDGGLSSSSDSYCDSADEDEEAVRRKQAEANALLQQLVENDPQMAEMIYGKLESMPFFSDEDSEGDIDEEQVHPEKKSTKQEYLVDGQTAFVSNIRKNRRLKGKAKRESMNHEDSEDEGEDEEKEYEDDVENCEKQGRAHKSSKLRSGKTLKSSRRNSKEDVGSSQALKGEDAADEANGSSGGEPQLSGTRKAAKNEPDIPLVKAKEQKKIELRRKAKAKAKLKRLKQKKWKMQQRLQNQNAKGCNLKEAKQEDTQQSTPTGNELESSRKTSVAGGKEITPTQKSDRSTIAGGKRIKKRKKIKSEPSELEKSPSKGMVEKGVRDKKDVLTSEKKKRKRVREKRGDVIKSKPTESSQIEDRVSSSVYQDQVTTETSEGLPKAKKRKKKRSKII